MIKIKTIICLLILLIIMNSVCVLAMEVSNEVINDAEETTKQNNLENNSTVNNSVTNTNENTQANKNKSLAGTNKKSDNANIKTLQLNVGELSPVFSEDVTEYYVIVDLTVCKITTKVTLSDNKAKITVKGNKNLIEGDNTIELTVTAESGITKVYYIHVTKTDNKEKSNANLSKLEVDGYNIYPEFKADIYNYNLTINNEVNKLNITTESENNKSSVEITGNENIKEGSTIQIKVTSEDKTIERIYKINIKSDIKEVQVEKEDKQMPLIAISVLLVIIIVLFIVVINKNKK